MEHRNSCQKFPQKCTIFKKVLHYEWNLKLKLLKFSIFLRIQHFKKNLENRFNGTHEIANQIFKKMLKYTMLFLIKETVNSNY